MDFQIHHDFDNFDYCMAFLYIYKACQVLILFTAKRGATDTHEGDKKKPRLEVIMQ